MDHLILKQPSDSQGLLPTTLVPPSGAPAASPPSEAASPVLGHQAGLRTMGKQTNVEL